MTESVPPGIEVHWEPRPQIITPEKLAQMYLWHGVSQIIHSHTTPFSPATVADSISELKVVESNILRRLGTEARFPPAFIVPWETWDISLSVIGSDTFHFGERDLCPRLWLSGSFPSGAGYTQIIFAYVRTEASGWRPVVVDRVGMMGVAVTHHPEHIPVVDLAAVFDQLVQARGL